MDQSQKAKEIFFKSLEFKDAENLRAFIETACSGSPSLLSEVEKLLGAHEQAGDFLGGPSALESTMDEGTSPDLTGEYIGDYKLLQQIGEGGFGIVYMAEQVRPISRKVAIKIIKPGMDSKEVIARFEAERQALAMMDHPNIARVLDAGTTQSSRPYFVMELVRGIPVNEYCDLQHIGTNARLELFATVCQAVQHAHQKGVIHRDIKPSNVLVTEHDGKPIAKVIDFGVAKAMSMKLTERTVFTRFQQMIGTPLYMSPEQAALSGLDVDTRTDIYSLGVLLYELLTGTTPFDKERLRRAAYDEFCRILREEEPPKPSTKISSLGELSAHVAGARNTEINRLRNDIRGDLDWIVMKALEKERARRYQTAASLAKDVQRFLDREPVEACPPSATYRIKKYILRHPTQIGMIATSCIAIILLAGLLVGTGIRAALKSKNEELSEKNTELELERQNVAEANASLQNAAQAMRMANEELQRARYFQQVSAAVTAWHDNEVERARELLKDCRSNMRNWEWHYARHLCSPDMRTYVGHSGWVRDISLSQDGGLMASASRDGTVRLWNVATGMELHKFRLENEVFCVALSSDGSRIAIGEASGRLSVWDLASKQLRGQLSFDNGPVSEVYFSRGDDYLISRVGYTAAVWNQSDERPALTVDLRENPRGTRDKNSIAVSPLDTRLAFLNRDGDIEVREFSANSSLIFDLPDGVGVETINFVNSEKLIFTTRNEKRFGTCDLKTNDYEITEKSYARPITGLCVNATRGWLITSHYDHTVRKWDLENFEPQGICKGHTNIAMCVATVSGGTQFFSGSRDGSIKCWDERIEGASNWNVHGGGVTDIMFSPEGNLIVSASWDGSLRATTIDTGSVVRDFVGHEGPVRTICMTDNQERLLSCGNDGTVRLWDFSTGVEQQTIVRAGETIRTVVLSPDESQIAYGGEDSRLSIWDVETDSLLHEFQHPAWVYDAVYVNDGKRIITGGPGENKILRIWSLTELTKAARELRGHTYNLWQLALSPDGRYLASGSYDQSIKIWELESETCVTTLRAGGWVQDVVFTPDGKRIAAAVNGLARLWDVASGSEALTLRLEPAISRVAFSPDGHRLATGHENGTIRVWNTNKTRLY